MSEVTATDITALPPADRAVIVLNSTKTEQELKALVEKSAGITTVIDPAGREEAHRAGMVLKTARVAIEKTGKAAREDATAFSKAVINEEKRLVGIIDAEESRVFGLRDAYDARVKAEKEEADRKERIRVQTIKDRIERMRSLPLSVNFMTAGAIGAHLESLKDHAIDETYGEFAEDAEQVRQTTITALENLHEQAAAREAEAKRIEEERQELARQQAEAAERERQACEQREAEEARARAIREEEERRLATERAAFEEERRLFAEQQEAARRAEEEKAAAEEAEKQAALTKDVANDDEVQAQNGRDGDLFVEDPAPAGELTGAAPTIFNVRAYAIATGEQFKALAEKAAAAGFDDFAMQLHAVGNDLSGGSMDAAIASGDLEAMHHADVSMTEYTADCRDILQPTGQEAA